jgi:hypothetical protein
MIIHPFIFNWKNKFDSTCRIEEELLKIFDTVTVINSDEENKKNNWINLDDSCYFTAQFSNAINRFNGDLFLQIQGDSSYYDWKIIVDSAIKYYEKYKYGIYAPNVDFTPLHAGYVNIKTDFFKEDKNLELVTMTDCTCWFIEKEIIDYFIKNFFLIYAETKHGWGISACMAAISFLKGKYVLRDYNYTIMHPKSTNYDITSAIADMDYFHDNLDEEIQTIIKNIRMNDSEYLLNLL